MSAMRRHCSPTLLARLVSALAVVHATADAQVPYQWTNLGQTGTWELPVNWLPPVEPNDPTAVVQIGNSAPCNLSSQVTIDSLSVASGCRLNIAAGASIDFGGNTPAIQNDGIIAVNTSGKDTPTYFFFESDIHLSGSGTIVLAGANPGNFEDDGEIYVTGGTTTNDAGHTIRGRGDIRLQQASFINNGNIIADDTNGRFVLQLDQNTFTNDSLVGASNGATLAVNGGMFAQSDNGTLRADGTGSTVVFNAAAHGGAFETANGGVIIFSSGTIDGCTNLGELVMINNSGSVDTLRLLAGGLTNDGSINLFALLNCKASTTISGSGDFQLTNGTLFISGVTVTNGSNHLLHGKGRVQYYPTPDQNGKIVTGLLVNNGTLSADDSTGQFYVPSITNSGSLNAAKGGTLVLEGSVDQTGGGTVSSTDAGSRVMLGGGLIAGGTYRTSSGGAIIGQGTTIQDATNLGELQTDRITGLTITGKGLVNNGVVRVSSSIAFDENTSLGGNGQVVLTGGSLLGGNSLTIGSGQIISGDGRVSAGSSNGTIAPTGKLQLAGSLTLTTTSNFVFRIGGTKAAADYGVIDKNDAAGLIGFVVHPVPLNLNGSLTVTLANGFVPSSSDTFTIFTSSAGQLQGSFSNLDAQGRLALGDGTGSFLVSYSPTAVTLSDYQAAASPTATPAPSLAPQPLNISTRLPVLTGNNVMIGGFIIAGTENKRVLLRAIGPSLASAGVTGALSDPVLELHGSDGAAVAVNDNWRDTQEQEIAATGIPPADDLESAIVTTLTPGSYTAVVSGNNGATGVALVEVYDLQSTAASKLANISTRGFVQTGDSVIVGGVILGAGAANQASSVLVRAIGPSLEGAGIGNALSDPYLELHDANGAILTANDNWKDAQQQAIAATRIPPSDDRESALLIDLAAGQYTAVVRGINDTTGVGLVEVYDLR